MPQYQATLVSGEGNRTLEWTNPATGTKAQDSPWLLCCTPAASPRRALRREVSSAGINGMHYWTIDGEISLRDLGAEAGVRTA